MKLQISIPVTITYKLKEHKISAYISFFVLEKRLIAIVNKEWKENEAKGINSHFDSW